MNFDNETAKIEAQIQEVKEAKYMPEDEKASRVNVLKSSLLVGTDTSAQTIMSLANTMIGSAIIVYPVLFIKDGMIGSSIIMLTVGCIQYLTCRLLVIHNRPNEITFNESILRIGGVHIDKINSVVNMLLLFFVSIAYFLLISTNFYQSTGAIIQEISGHEIPKTSKLTFREYSFQWACIICAVLCVATLFKRNIDPILKLMKFSIYCVASYFIFVLVNLFRRIFEGSINFSEYKFFDPDFSNVAGAFALSFLIHPTAAPILKKSINLKNNERDLLFGYILTAGIYFFVGFIGGLTCAPSVELILSPETESDFNTIFDCFNFREGAEQAVFYWISKVVQAGILFQNFSVLPIIFFLTRKEFITLVNKPHLEKTLFNIFTTVFLICSTLVGVLGIDVSLILSFDGAVIGFLMGYGIPIYIHLKCLFHKFTSAENKKRRQIIGSTATEQSLIESEDIDEETEGEILACNEHKAANKKKEYILYGFLLVIGVALGIFKIYSFFGSSH